MFLNLLTAVRKNLAHGVAGQRSMEGIMNDGQHHLAADVIRKNTRHRRDFLRVKRVTHAEIKTQRQSFNRLEYDLMRLVLRLIHLVAQ